MALRSVASHFHYLEAVMSNGTAMQPGRHPRNPTSLKPHVSRLKRYKCNVVSSKFKPQGCNMSGMAENAVAVDLNS